MKFVTFEVKTPLGPFSRTGLWVDDLIIDLNTAYGWLLSQEGEAQPQRIADLILPPDMLEIIKMGRSALKAAQLVLNAKESIFRNGLWQERRMFFKIQEVRLLAPLPNPVSLRDFQAFEMHTKKGYELRKETVPEPWYQMPVYYKGNVKSIIGPEDELSWPSYTRKLDYELEFACIVGKKIKNLTLETAKDAIFGYTILNDFSARDIQKKEMACRLGPAKGKDFATSIGPCIVTVDELPDLSEVTMEAWINGECWSEGVFGSIHWSFEEMIVHVSRDECLYPGEIFGSGTVGGGCGLELNRWIQPGDEVKLVVSGVGELVNRIGPYPESPTRLDNSIHQERAMI